MRRPYVAVVLLLFVTAIAAEAADPRLEQYGGCAGSEPQNVVDATPLDYRDFLHDLAPGDHLRLAAGTYTQGLPLVGLAGEPGNCIVIEGPAVGTAVFEARSCCNTVELTDVSYFVLRRLELDGMGEAVDAVKAKSEGVTHHVTLEELTIHGHGDNQQVVGISTKGEAWNWVIRRNRIEGAGTGMYLGDSNGDEEFVNGLIEYNVILDPIGYGIQIKHQVARSTGLGVPSSGETILRHNVIAKTSGYSTGGDARPNLLLGHFPTSGAGAGDRYLVYANLLYDNPSGEPLFQGEGNLELWDNLLVNPDGSAVWIVAHNDKPRDVTVAHNTVVASGDGILVSGGEVGFEQRVVANVVFAATPLAGGTQSDNVVDSRASADSHLTRPFAVPDGTGTGLELRPLPGQLLGAAVDPGYPQGLDEVRQDFAGAVRTGLRRGAYSGNGAVPAWALELAEMSPPAFFADGFESGGTSGWSASTRLGSP